MERVALMNYKSILRCDVRLRALTVIVGRNGSGKSNFLDSLHFVSDALLTTLEYAIRKRGGIRTLVHQRGEQKLGIAFDFTLAEGKTATYVLQLNRGRVSEESLTINLRGTFSAGYKRLGTAVKAQVGATELAVLPEVLHDRLALVTLSGVEAFREAFDALTGMRFYRLNPDAMRDVQDPDEGEVLSEDGSNIPSVWNRLKKTNPSLLRRLLQYLEAIVPGITRIHWVAQGPKETLRFHQRSATGERELSFHSSSMADGTLRALGVLVASRPANGSRPAATVVAIEEPETALHPGAIAAMMDALREASAKTQILLTTHSPDVLDQIDIASDTLLVTESQEGATVIAEVDGAGREAIRRHLYTPGELLRMDQLQPSLATE